MVTKNNIQIWFKDFASNHTQLKDYGYGDFSDISMERATTYPLMWVSPQPCSIDGNQISYSYTIAIADRCDKERTNAVEVESDTFQICLDILAGANDQANATGWMLSETSTLTPFFETWKDEVEGHMVTVTLIVDFDYDKCQIPTISAVTPPSVGCADGQVNVNATFYNDVASGSSLNVVVKNVAGSLVGSLIGGEWIVPNAITCVDSTAVIKDSAGTTLKTQAISSGATANITINDSTAIVKNSENTTIASATDIKAEGSKDIAVADTPYTIKDQSLNVLATGNLVSAKAGQIISLTVTSPPIFTYVNGYGEYLTANGGTTTTSIDTTTSNVIVVNINSGLNITLSDSKGNTWIQLTQRTTAFTNVKQCQYYCINPTVGSGHTFTVSGAAGCSPRIDLSCFKSTGTPTFEQAIGANANNSLLTRPGSMTPTNNNELFVVGVCIPSDTFIEVNSAFSISSGRPSPNQGGSAYKLKVDLNAENPSWGFSGSSFACSMIRFKP